MSRQEILILNGPNLNALGRREPERYGASTLAELEQSWQDWSAARGVPVLSYQSNFEGELLERLHRAEEEGQVAAVLLNPGAFTHTSRALRDAIASLSIPVVEVHLTHIGSRELWRRESVVSEVCRGSISGFGAQSYLLGLEAVCGFLDQS